MQTWIRELKRRNVFRVALFYLSVGWFIAQGLSLVFNTFGAPPWMGKVLIALLVLGFVPALVFAWLYEITPEGIRREAEVEPGESITPETGKRLNRMIVASLSLAVLVLLGSHLWQPSEADVATQPVTVVSAAPVADTPAPAGHSIAVLPLANTTGDPELAFFSDGVSEELISTLAQSTSLKVIGRMSSFRFKGSTDDTASIGRALGAAYLLGGSVRGADEKLRINVALVEAATGTNEWSQSYDRDSRDLLAVQREIAVAVAGHLQARLRGDSAVPEPMTDARLAAYKEAMQGRHFHNQGTEEGIATAVAHFETAIEHDPSYVMAHALLANSLHGHAQLRVFDGDPRAGQPLLQRAREEAETAIRMNPELAYGHAALSLILMSHALFVEPVDLALVEASALRAMALAPEDPSARAAMMFWKVNTGRAEEALPIIQGNLATDPLHVASWTALRMAHHYLGNFVEAERALRQGMALRPAVAKPYELLAIVLMDQGRIDEARRELEEITFPEARAYTAAMLHLREGEQDKADASLQWLIDHRSADMAFYIAELYADRSDDEQVFAWLERAAAQSDSGLAGLAYSPMFLRYRSDPRLAAFTRKHGLPPPAPDAAAGA